MQVEALLSIAESRGLSVALKEGQPVLLGPAEQKTEAILDCLKVHRREIVIYLQAATAEVEYRWATGLTATRLLRDGVPIGATQWRNPGDEAWRDVPQADRRAATAAAKAAVRQWKTEANTDRRPPY